MRKVVRQLALSASLVFAPLGQAVAHAHLEASAPAGASTVPVPSDLDLTFSEEVNLKFTGVRLAGPLGSDVKLDHPALVNGGKTLTVHILGAMAAGPYTVDWHALSADGHKTQGQFKFTVKP
jgi:methionine-rich copper-binding protein CopC